jgi:hypothetical protein
MLFDAWPDVFSAKYPGDDAVRGIGAHSLTVDIGIKLIIPFRVEILKDS